MYIANHYVRVGQDLLKKGDLIPSDLPEDKIKWLLEAGAIQKATVPLKFYGHGELPVVPASEAAEAIPLVEAETEEESIDSTDEEEDIERKKLQRRRTSRSGSAAGEPARRERISRPKEEGRREKPQRC